MMNEGQWSIWSLRAQKCALICKRRSWSVSPTPCNCFLMGCVGEVVANDCFFYNLLLWILDNRRTSKGCFTPELPQFGRNKRHVGALALKWHLAPWGCRDLGELLFLFLRGHGTLCEEKLTLSPLCLTEGPFLWTSANCCPVISPAALTQSRHSLLNCTSGLSVFFLLLFFPSSFHFHSPQGWGFLIPTATHWGQPVFAAAASTALVPPDPLVLKGQTQGYLCCEWTRSITLKEQFAGRSCWHIGELSPTRK